MNAQERRDALEQLVGSTEPNMTGIPLLYHGERKTFNAYAIPLDFLVYNQYNGRIGSVVKSFERQSHAIDIENPDDVKLIEKFLWESKESANKKTRKSLLEDHQQRYGIVTSDGIIIDGNRRACLLNSIRRDEEIPANLKQHCEYFIAIILPGDADKKEILRLETTYQMGEDAKVDYNPIEKYLKCQDLKDAGFTEGEIANFMGDTPANVNMYLSVLKLMNEYLDYYEYSGIFTMLAEDKREDSFQKLNSALKGYKAGASSMWDYDPEVDVEDLKLIAFDYIRYGLDQNDFRDIIRKPTATNRNTSFFGCKDIWTSFREKHFATIDPISEGEESVSSIISDAAGGDITRRLRARDSSWKSKIDSAIKENFGKSQEKLHNKQEADNPLKLLQKALDALEDVDTTQASFMNDPEVLECIKAINKTSWEYKKILEK